MQSYVQSMAVEREREKGEEGEREREKVFSSIAILFSPNKQSQVISPK